MTHAWHGRHDWHMKAGQWWNYRMPGAAFTISLDLRLDLRLLKWNSARVQVKSYSQWEIIQTRLSHDLSHDVSLISRRCLVCVTFFFHSESVTTIVTSPRMHGSNIAVHGCPRTWIHDGDYKNGTMCSQHNILEYTKPVVNIFVWEDLSTHIFVSVAVIYCICKTNATLVAISKGESRC